MMMMMMKAVLLSLACCIAASAPLDNHPYEITPPADAQCLLQANFSRGTLIIAEPGAYKLCEDVSFKPNPVPWSKIDDDGDGVHPLDAFLPDLAKYNRFNYGLGYFAAISIKTSAGVDIYLNSFKIEQSQEHALLQRFFAVIELAGSPFISEAGPADFVGPNNRFVSASNVNIWGPGTIGRSSHHGIHGNDCNNIRVERVTFVDFEVAAVSLNNVDNLTIVDCEIPHNRKSVPVSGMFSAAVFISRYGKWLAERYPTLSMSFADGGEPKTSVVLYETLADSIGKAYRAVMNGEAVDSLYRNHLGMVDGPCYVFLVHGKGPAVDDFGEHFDSAKERTSSNVVIQNNKIRNIKCWNKEIPAAVIDGAVQNDARGAVFQFVDTFTGENLTISEEGFYVGNPVANMQLFVANAIHDGILPSNHKVLQTKTNTLHPKLVKWATTPGMVLKPEYRCDGDSMHHVAKGTAVIRVDDTKGFTIRDNRIERVENLSVKSFGPQCKDRHAKLSINESGQKIAEVRGISVAASRSFQKGDGSNIRRRRSQNVETEYWHKPSQISGNVIRSFTSKQRETKIVGIDLQGETKGVVLWWNLVSLRSGSKAKTSKKYSALRLRSSVDKPSVTIYDKKLLQEGIVVEKDKPVRRRLEFELEWPNGNHHDKKGGSGCPFAH